MNKLFTYSLALWMLLASSCLAATYSGFEALDFGDRNLRFVEETLTKDARAEENLATHLLGSQKFLGIMTRTSRPDAREYYRAAAERGYLYSQLIFADIHLTESEPLVPVEESVEWLKRAQASNKPSALFLMGQFHLGGHGMPKDPVAAFEAMKRAAQSPQVELPRKPRQMNFFNESLNTLYEMVTFDFMQAENTAAINAQYTLANFYNRGIGTEVDKKHAYMWFYVASKNYPEGPTNIMESIEEEISREDRNEAREMAEQWLD